MGCDSTRVVSSPSKQQLAGDGEGNYLWAARGDRERFHITNSAPGEGYPDTDGMIKTSDGNAAVPCGTSRRRVESSGEGTRISVTTG